MEYNINILDSFPSLNKIHQKNNLFLEFNNKDYFLNKLISQQETMITKKSSSKFYFKIYLLYNAKKELISSNYINQDIIKFDNNKSFITWLEFRKRNQDNNNKEINDFNYLFFDCIRLKIKITLNKTIPKTDKRIKTTKSKIKIGYKTPNITKKDEVKFEYNNINEIYNDINDNLDIIRKDDNNYLLKSESQEENIKLNKEILDNKISNKNILEQYNNLHLKPEERITQELKSLIIENDCLLTDNNLIENYSYSTSLGDNNNKIKNKAEFENKIKDDIKSDNINYDHDLKNSLISFNNYKLLNKQENNNTAINTSFNDEDGRNKKIKMMKSKFKSLNKLIKAKNEYQEKKIKKCKANPINKNKNNNSNKTHSLVKEKTYSNSNTYNNFYKKNPINEENNKYLETNVINENINNFTNILLISHENEINNNIIKKEKAVNHDEYDEFISMKKDYDLLYTSVFIKAIKKDLLDLEFNIALEKSISLFLTYNSKIFLLSNQKKDLISAIKTYANKSKVLNKKIYLLNILRNKKEMEDNNKLILDEFNKINLKKGYISQKTIFENLINDKMKKKIMLKSIISILLKKKPEIIKNITPNSKKMKNKYIIKSPSKVSKNSKIKSPQTTKQKPQFEFMSEIKNKNLIFANKLINKKKSLNKNLKKNRSINYLVSFENVNEQRNHFEKTTISKNNLYYNSTSKNKFYISKNEKAK